MRELKFRAWDLNEDEYIPWEHLIQIRYNQDFYKTKNPDAPILSALTDKYIVLEQFSGLLDKNGKPIYENDVIIIGVGKHEWTMVIEPLAYCIDGPLYGVERFCNFSISEDGEFIWEKNIEDGGRRYELPFLDKSRTIIGTIHDAEYKDLAK